MTPIPVAAAPRHRHVAMIIYPGCVLLDACGAMEVFEFANIYFSLSGYLVDSEKAYSMSFIAVNSGPVVTSCGLKLVADYGYDTLDKDIDTLMIAGAPNLSDVLKDARLCTFLNTMLPKVRRMVSICTGAFALAESGILRGRRATTHWLYSDCLHSQYQDINVEADKIYIRDGNVYTSGGVTAGMDLALSLVEEDWGSEVASGAAKGMLLFLRRPGGQSQFSTYIVNEAKTRKDFRELQAWMASHLEQDLSVEQLAERMAMSPRNFSRTFCQEIGMSPGKFVERVRLEAAKQMMSQSDLSLDTVACSCGFGSAEQMRRAFQRLMNTSPQAHRAYFKAAG